MEETQNSRTYQTLTKVRCFKTYDEQIYNINFKSFRYGQHQTALSEDHILIIGGCGGPNSIFKDAWILDMSKKEWQWKNVVIRDQKWAAQYIWCSPICRVGNSKLVVFDATPNLPTDFQLVKRIRQDNDQIRIPNNDLNQNPQIQGILL